MYSAVPVINTVETASNASARLKAFEQSGSAEALARVQELGRPNRRSDDAAARTGTRDPRETPRWPGGLVTSRDGYYWTVPDASD